MGLSDRQALLAVHQERVRGLVQQGGEGRKVDELLADDRFIDNLADKISMRLGGSTGAAATQALQSLSASATQGPWASGAGMNLGNTGMTQTLTGRPTIMRPDPPSFAEPADEQSRASLPRALMGAGGATRAGANVVGQGRSREASTQNDVNSFTQEKMRGDCYVRLLIHPDDNAARKDPLPYSGDTKNPDTTLVTGPGRPNLVVPPKPPRVNEDGDIEEDDEFADFERNDTVVFSFVRHNRYDAVEALIQQEMEILLARDEHGNTLLHIACQNNNRRIAKLLLKNGISVNEQNAHGNTPLHYCSQYGFMQLADYLIAHGADDSIPNHMGMLPPQGIGRIEDAMNSAQRQLQSERTSGL